MMKKTLALIIGLTGSMLSFAQTPCVDGFAGIYPCDKVDMLSSLTTDQIGGAQNQADIWGWTSDTGREFAIVCKSNGTAFVEVSDPLNPVYLGDLPTKTVNSLWRDAKVYGDYAFIVSEAPGHGMQIFDMTQLLDLEVIPSAFDSTNTTHYAGFGNAHNIVINEDSGRAYGVGTSTFFGGLHTVDISDPLNPTIVGSFAEDGYTHDAQVVNYHGPDLDYCDAEIAFNSNTDAVTIANVTDPQDAYMISRRTYSDSGYTHQCWLTPDHEFLFVNDELDELGGLVTNTTTFIWDVRDLDDPILVDRYTGETTAIDHNLYVKWNQIYASNYRAGLRILDASKAESGELNEIGYFDSQPSDDDADFSGTWSNYPYFESGIVVMTDMYGDFFVLQPRTISADYSQTISLGDASAAYNVYFAAEEDAEINVANLPDGILLAIEDVEGLGAAEVELFDLADLAAGSYDFDIVVSIDGNDQVFPAQLIVDENPTNAISILGPVDNFSVNSIDPEFVWETNFEAGTMLLEVSTTPVFDDIVSSFEVSESPAISPTSFIEGDYYWRLSTIPVCNEP
ncbi:MAG: choice-of-anchor B family protein, partial [Flavobacteriales bacterium]